MLVEVPDKPTWIGRIDEICQHLAELPTPWVDRQILESILGLRARRVQQLLMPVVSKRIGRNGLADRDDLIPYLRRIAEGEKTHYERQRRRKLACVLDELRQSWTEQRRVLVEAPTNVVNQEIADLPAGVQLSPGQILLEFQTKDEALTQLLALVMAIGNDPDHFESCIRLDG